VTVFLFLWFWIFVKEPVEKLGTEEYYQQTCEYKNVGNGQQITEHNALSKPFKSAIVDYYSGGHQRQKKKEKDCFKYLFSVCFHMRNQVR